MLLVLLNFLVFSQANKRVAPPTATTAANAGNKYKITGRIIDSVSQSPVEYATITLYAQHNTRPVNGITTGPKGTFALEALAPGNYTLTIDFIGYQPRSFGPLTLGDKLPALSLGNILLAKKAQDLA